ncbi:MAG: ribbon-helix-helix protein, CopG family [Lachnospiraceae bacterium]|nr:ribbon-helix-helix protein, CopG family [Lachnospiraceae bacterium]
MAQEKNNRLFLSVSDADLSRLDVLREELGMNRSQYIRYLISGQKRLLIPSVKYKELISKISQIDLSLRVIALKEEMTSEDKLLVYSKLDEVKRILTGMDTFGHDDQKSEEED